MNEKDILGKQVIAEFFGCKMNLDNFSLVKEVMEKAAICSNATIVESIFHHFNPYGISGVIVIAESHLAIHTWPDKKYAAIDIFTCGDLVNPMKMMKYIKQAFQPKDFSYKKIRRGLSSKINMYSDNNILEKKIH